MNNNSLSALVQQAAPRVVKAIKNAADKTGVDFAYLVEKASVESSFRPDAKAKGSSARGLFQFIDSTWMRMVKTYGDKYGMGKLAAKIDDNGHVKSADVRKEILNLRKDPEKSAMMAAEYALENKRYMERFLGQGEVGSTEMYLAHFMGAGGATSFLQAQKENPLQTAADLFPKAARANRNVFYDKETGQPRTLAGVYAYYDARFKNGGSDDFTLPGDSKFDAQVAQVQNTENDADSSREKALASLRAFSESQNEFIAQNLADNDESGNVRAFFSANRSAMRHETIHWNSPRIQTRDSIQQAGLVSQPAAIMMMAQLEPAKAFGDHEDESRYQ